MEKLKSDWFRGDARLEAALNHHPAHITPGAKGDHVKKIQAALESLLTDPPVAIAAGERGAGLYGPSTADAVLRYKTENNIINRSYQTRPDNVVGKMTMRALDDAMLGGSPAAGGKNVQIAAAILPTLGRLDQVLGPYALALSPMLRARLERLRAEAAAAAGATRTFDGEVKDEYDRGIVRLNAVPIGQPGPFQLVAAPAVAVAGVAVTALEAAVVATGVVLLLCAVSDDFRDAVSTLATRALDAMAEALIQAFADATAFSDLVDECNMKNQTPNPLCGRRREDFQRKRDEFETKHGDAKRAVLDALKRFGKVVPLSQVKDFKEALKKARAAMEVLKTVLKEFEELKDLLWKDCGCRFLMGF
jgi:hypothetical protein